MESGVDAFSERECVVAIVGTVSAEVDAVIDIVVVVLIVIGVVVVIVVVAAASE